MKRKIVFVVCICVALISCLCACVEKQNDSKNSPETLLHESEDPVTLGDLEAQGYDYQGYVNTDDGYVFWYTTDTRSYRINVDTAEDIQSSIDSLDALDDDYEDQLRTIRHQLVIANIEALNDEPLSDKALSEYVGQKVSQLIDDGFEVNGYASVMEEYNFYFIKDNQEYLVTLDASIFDIMQTNEYGDEKYKTKIPSCVIEKIEYSRPCCW